MTSDLLELIVRILICCFLYATILFLNKKKQFIIESLGETIFKLNIFAFWFMLIGNLIIFIADYAF